MFYPNDPRKIIFQDKKLINNIQKGDATWTTCKRVLSWIVNKLKLTISIPITRLEKVRDELAEFPAS